MTIDRQTYTAQLAYSPLADNSQPAPLTLNPIDFTVTLDSNWAPYAQGTLVIPTPANLADFSSRVPGLDAGTLQRAPNRIVVDVYQEYCASDHLTTLTATYAHASDFTAAFAHASDMTAQFVHDLWGATVTRPAVHRTFNLAINEMTPRSDGTSILTLSSDETYTTEVERPLQTVGATLPTIGGIPPGSVPATALRPFILGLLFQYVYAAGSVWMPPGLISVNAGVYRWGETTLGFDFDIAALNAGTPLAASPWSFLWDFLATYIDLAGGRLWCDETLFWHFEPAAYHAPGTWVFDVGNAVDWDGPRGRSGNWYNAVAVIYTWTDAAGASHTQTDYASVSGTSLMSGVFERTFVVQRTTPYPGDGAAAQLLARVSLYGDDSAITAVNDFSLVPSQAASITFPDAVRSGYVGAVTFDMTTAEMSVSARQLA